MLAFPSAQWVLFLFPLEGLSHISPNPANPWPSHSGCISFSVLEKTNTSEFLFISQTGKLELVGVDGE